MADKTIPAVMQSRTTAAAPPRWQRSTPAAGNSRRRPLAVVAELDRWIKQHEREATQGTPKVPRRGLSRFADVKRVALRFQGDRLDPEWLQVVVFEDTTLSRSDKNHWRNWRSRTERKLHMASACSPWSSPRSLHSVYPRRMIMIMIVSGARAGPWPAADGKLRRAVGLCAESQ